MFRSSYWNLQQWYLSKVETPWRSEEYERNLRWCPSWEWSQPRKFIILFHNLQAQTWILIDCFIFSYISFECLATSCFTGVFSTWVKWKLGALAGFFYKKRRQSLLEHIFLKTIWFHLNLELWAEMGLLVIWVFLQQSKSHFLISHRNLVNSA